MNREEKNRKQREYRNSNLNSCTKVYEKSYKGFLMRLYRNMQSRIVGIQKKKYHLYKDKSLLSREEFYIWALSNPDFISLFETYKKANFDRKLAPSVDRKDSFLGYEISNMEFITMSENSSRGAKNKKVLGIIYKTKNNSV